MKELPNPRDLAVWNRLVETHEAFALASTEFLTGDVDRVAVLRSILHGHGRKTAFYILQFLKQTDLQELFEDLVFHASYAHGAVGTVRNAILSLPRDWILANIEEIAEPLLANGTYDEYRRLLELYALLDPDLTRKLAARAAQHPAPDIREVGQDFLA